MCYNQFIKQKKGAEMAIKDKKLAFKEFAEFWKDKGYEKGESQSFWLDLLAALGVEYPSHYIRFESQVKLDNTSFIDGIIDETHVLIEQKSIDKSLSAPIKQSDGSMLNPFQQAKRYAVELPFSQRPRWIVTCNFKEFYIYDMEKPNCEPEKILLADLPKEYYRLDFLVDKGNDDIKREFELSIQAGELVGKLYDALAKQYHNIDDEESQKSLNKLCVRIVFCLYAEDAGIFGDKKAFYNYIKSFNPQNVRAGLIELFKVLDTKPENRDPYMNDNLKAFPYVNGGLFADESIEIPQLTSTILNIIQLNMCQFDWSQISPTIFGAVFESTLNPETRRKGGMHYTSIENIHKVIDPLFLDDLRAEFDDIKNIGVATTRKQKLEAFRDKISKLTFLDPACGSGNFLTETYISLRKLENEALELLYSKNNELQIRMDEVADIKVNIGQFYGIEINDFAVTVAKTALWIAESQMMNKTNEIVHTNDNFLPLKTNANIVEGNALTLDWETVVPKDKLNYIMGNPPFVGAMMMDRKQKEEFTIVLGDLLGVGEMDYVVGWYYKAAELMKNSDIEAAFVSTNSICQGQQAVYVWKPLLEQGIKINFAHKTFIWDSEATLKAHVHCIIVGFSYNNKPIKYLYESGRCRAVLEINSYLSNAPMVFVENRSTPLFDVPPMNFGNMPRDGGAFILREQEKNDLLKAFPTASKWVKLYLGAEEFINNKKRYCLWLQGANPAELKQNSFIMSRINSVREFRSNSKAAGTRKFAEMPTLFCQITQPVGEDYLLIPRVSSENRRYIPIGFLDGNTIASDAVQIIPNATLYHFGVLTSNVHNAWMRVVCGRLKSDYRYSKDIVYNNFPWPTPTDEQKQKIEKTAQTILDVRALYPDCSLADLYDELTMPTELRKAHQANDKAVMEAYGFSTKMTESECVAELMKMYQELTK